MNSKAHFAGEFMEPRFFPVGADLRVRPPLDLRVRGNDGQLSAAIFNLTLYAALLAEGRSRKSALARLFQTGITDVLCAGMTFHPFSKSISY